MYLGVMGSLTVHDWAANLNVLLADIWQPDAEAQVWLPKKFCCAINMLLRNALRYYS